MKNFLFFFGLTLFLLWGAVRIVQYIQFDRNCTGYLKRAADSNDIELAEQELSKAINYIEQNNYIAGYTSIFYTTPDEDLSFWYKNLKSAQENLQSLDSKTISDLEESNILMKLRETLMDGSASSSGSVTVPFGIDVFPHNKLYAFWGTSSFIILLIGGIWWLRSAYGKFF